MDAVGEKEKESEKIFEYYSWMPYEIREIVIDQLSPNTRCRFRRCSKLCENLADSSENYMFALVLIIESEQQMTISVRHSALDVQAGYFIVFKMENDNRYMIYKNGQSQELWRTLLYPSTELDPPRLVEKACQLFTNLLTRHRRSIKKLCIDLREAVNTNFDFGGIRMLKLEELKICGNVDYLQLLSNLPHRLKILKVENNNLPLLNLEQIYQLDCLMHSSLRLTIEELHRLSAFRVYIPIGDLTVDDIINFLENGTFSMKRLVLNLGGSTFNLIELVALLGWTEFVRTPLGLEFPRRPGEFVYLKYVNQRIEIFINRLDS